MESPVIVGGLGHSGTRIFAQLLEHNGVFVGWPRLTRKRGSYDLFLKSKLNKWVEPYIYGTLTDQELETMRGEFKSRLNILFPLRSKRWGFKNPRTLLILPEMHEIFPDMKFIHVVRDGRDISLGNEFVSGNTYVNAFLSKDEKSLSESEKMILFWGRANRKGKAYCDEHMSGQSMMVRFEELCEHPDRVIQEIAEFLDLSKSMLNSSVGMVKKPGSIGRWRNYQGDIKKRVQELGNEYLEEFGYALP